MQEKKIQKSMNLNFKNLFLKFGIFVLIILSSIINCKKQKLPEFHDEAWRKESLEKAASICEKLLQCSTEVTDRLNPKLKKYSNSEMSAGVCVEKFKKSNVYHLRGEDPNQIKTYYKSCFEQINSFGCNDLKSGKLDSLEDCNQIKRIQKI